MKYTFSVILLFVALSWSTRSPAQDWLWARGNTGGIVDAWPVATDPSGNVFVAGLVEGPSPAVFGPFSAPYSGSKEQAVIAKYDGAGHIKWVNEAIAVDSGGSWVYNIATDRSGNSFMFGVFSSKTLQAGGIILTNTIYPEFQYFLIKYDPAGNVLWARNDGNAFYGGETIGGLSVVLGTGGVATDATGNVYITANFHLPVITVGTVTLTNADPSGKTDDILVAEYDPYGNLVWAKSAGGSKNDDAFSIALAPAGDVYIAGVFGSPAVTFGASVITSTVVSPAQNAFIARFDNAGNALWACGSGGSGGEYAVGLATDLSGNVYLTGGLREKSIAFNGYTVSNPTPGRSVLYLVKFNHSNTALWSKTIYSPNSGTGVDSFRTGTWGYSIAMSQCGIVWVSGAFSDSVLIDSNLLVAPASDIGNNDPVFMAGYTSSGTYVGSAALPSGGDDQNGIACDPAGNIYMCSDYLGNIFFKAGPDVLPKGTAKGEYLYVAKYPYLNNAENFKHSNNNVCLGTGITLFAPQGYDYYRWSSGIDSAVYTVADTGAYWVYSFDSCGASSSDTFNVAVTCYCGKSLFLPNTFTPNGDGMNDIFYPRSSNDIKKISSFRIYDRWGQLLFDRENILPNDASNAWDGAYQGDKPRPDVYVWVVEAICENDNKISRKGSVTIIR